MNVRWRWLHSNSSPSYTKPTGQAQNSRLQHRSMHYTNGPKYRYNIGCVLDSRLHLHVHMRCSFLAYFLDLVRTLVTWTGLQATMVCYHLEHSIDILLCVTIVYRYWVLKIGTVSCTRQFGLRAVSKRLVQFSRPSTLSSSSSLAVVSSYFLLTCFQQSTTRPLLVAVLTMDHIYSFGLRWYRLIRADNRNNRLILFTQDAALLYCSQRSFH